MPQKTDSQIQIRIDAATKKKTQKILGNIGLDISSAVRLFFKQIINTGALPLENRDENGFTLKKSLELKEAMIDAGTAKKFFKKPGDLIKSLLA